MAIGPHDVLLIDDDVHSREALSQLLNEIGLMTAQAGNGREALEQLRRMPRPALIVLDLQMPVMDGWTFLRQQARDRELSRIPVVVVTGVEPEQQPEVVPVLQKPLELQQLQPFLRRYCGLK
jgi:CheY-like chemotaxis protein